MYLGIIVLPLLGSLVSGLLGRKIGITGSKLITCGSLIICSILISIAFYEVGLNGSPVYINLGTWIDSEMLLVSWEFYFDQLTVTLGLAVIFCSTLIHIYSIDYLSSDPHQQRFFSYLSAFTAGMLILICGGNYLVMFVGWEFIGVVSYLLINFYFTRIQANKAAILAFTMNRLGDTLISIGFFAIFAVFGTFNYSQIFSMVPFMNELAISIITLLLIGGALAKSANIPLHSWLPGSMEAPTPVSALLHAATLVTAGIYLLLRSSPLLEYSPDSLLVIVILGSTTSFFAATCGLVANDLKRIIAFSTISQLGYMFMAIGLSLYNVALMHTVNHAFFKALLFLGAGAVIHSFQDEQDVRKMGGLIKFLPFTYSAMLAGSLSLIATPYLTAFYSKDLILELAYSSYSFSGTYAFILGTTTAGITAFYSVRLLSLVFLTVPNGAKFNYEHTHDSNNFVIIPLTILAILSIGFGYIVSDLLAGMGTDFLGNSVFIQPKNIYLIEAEFSMSSYIKLLPLIFTLIGASSAFLLYNFDPFINMLQQYKWWAASDLPKAGDNLLDGPSKVYRSLYAFLNGKYYFDVVYNNFIVVNGLKLGFILSNNIDRGAIELVGPFGLSKILTDTGSNISKLDTGSITTYALYFTIGLLSLLIITIIAPLYLQSLYVETGSDIFYSNSSWMNSNNCIRLVVIYLTCLTFIYKS